MDNNVIGQVYVSPNCTYQLPLGTGMVSVMNGSSANTIKVTIEIESSMNQRELLISRMRGLEAEYAAKETELENYPQREKLIQPKLDYIAEQYEKWEKMLNEEVDNSAG